MAQDYRSIYDAWHRNLPVDAEADTPWHRMVRESVSGEPLGGMRVLEIGCGRGGLACWLARSWRDLKLTACDFSPAAVKMGKAFADSMQLDNIEWCVADIQRMPWSANTFDMVISCETVEHVLEPRRAVQELVRVLQPGGSLLLTAPNYFNLFGLHRIYAQAFRGRRFQEEGQPINQFVLLPVLYRWVRSAGVDISLVRSVNHSLPFPGRPGITVRSLESAPFPFPWLGNNSFIRGTKRSGSRA